MIISYVLVIFILVIGDFALYTYQIRFFMMYLLMILSLIILKFANKILTIKLLFISSVPLLFIIFFNIYISLVLNEFLFKIFKVDNLSLRNILNCLFCNFCSFMMKKVVRLQFKIKIY